MIRRPRSPTAPSALETRYSSRSQPPKSPGLTEREAVVEAFNAHIGDGKPEFKFDRYRHQEIKDALHAAFHGKCAYCESRYAGTQPMDVEHWRPKGGVHDDDEHPGYYWLAADWLNLFPSCIDCNRGRTQDDIVLGKKVRLGKADQFPVAGTRSLGPDGDLLAEEPLLLDPCCGDEGEDPEDFFRYTEEGVIQPRHPDGDKRLRAEESIRVYALNRSELVAERLAVRRLVDHRLERIHHLRRVTTQSTELRDSFDQSASAADRERLGPGWAQLFDSLDDLIAAEVDELLAMEADDRPYAGMVRAMLREAEELGVQ